MASVVFLIGALRAVIELISLSLLARWVLYLLAGEKRRENVIYRLFALLTDPPLSLCSRVLPGRSSRMFTGAACLIILVIMWFLLAILRKWLLT